MRVKHAVHLGGASLGHERVDRAVDSDHDPVFLLAHDRLLPHPAQTLSARPGRPGVRCGPAGSWGYFLAVTGIFFATRFSSPRRPILIVRMPLA